MAIIVLLPAIVAEEPHRIALHHVLRVLLDELPHRVPQRGDGRGVLGEGDGEAVLEVVILHEEERVVREVAEEVDVGSAEKIEVMKRRRRGKTHSTRQ